MSKQSLPQMTFLKSQKHLTRFQNDEAESRRHALTSFAYQREFTAQSKKDTSIPIPTTLREGKDFILLKKSANFKVKSKQPKTIEMKNAFHLMSSSNKGRGHKSKRLSFSGKGFGVTSDFKT